MRFLHEIKYSSYKTSMTLETMLKKYAISIKSTYEYILIAREKKSNLEGYDTYNCSLHIHSLTPS